MKNKIAFAAVLLLISSHQEMFAGAWTREKNEMYLKTSFSHFSSDQIYRHSQNRKITGPDFSDTSLSFYGEYGLSEKTTFIGSFEHKSLISKSTGVKTTESGLGDMWLCVKKRMLKAPFLLSMQFGLKIPLGYNEDKSPPLGDGQFDWEERLIISQSFISFPGYGSAEIGYRKRMGDYSDVLPFVIEAGVFAHKNLLFKLSVNGIKNLTNDVASDIGIPRSPNVFDKEYMKLTPAVILLGKNGVSCELYYETFLSGANTAAGDTVGLGVSWQGRAK